MELIIRYLLGVVILIIAFPLGNYLAKITKEELKEGRKWFRLIIILNTVGIVIGIAMIKIELIFWFGFVMIITWRSMKK